MKSEGQAIVNPSLHNRRRKQGVLESRESQPVLFIWVFDYSPEFDVLDGIGSRLVPFRRVLRVYERVELNDALGMTLRRVLFDDVFRTIFGERHWSSSSKRTTRGHETVVDGLVITTTYVHDATLIFGRKQNDGIKKKNLIITTGRDVVYGGGKKNKI